MWLQYDVMPLPYLPGNFTLPPFFGYFKTLSERDCPYLGGAFIHRYHRQPVFFITSPVM